VVVDPERVKIIMPQDFEMPPGGLHIRWPDAPLEQEARLFDYKWYAALAYVRANRLNHNVIAGPERPLRHHRQRQGLQRHAPGAGRPGPGRRHLPLAGHPLHKVNVVWPLEATITRDFAQGLQEILVVEEKRQVIEYQLKEELYNWRPDVRPNVLGKFDDTGEGVPPAASGAWPTPARTGCCAPRPT
jgi:indolepyruvate ferredoxin oxidoreductase